MPFTPSHIAAVLPFARSPLPPAALALGSMAPDLPYFLPLDIPREFTHSLPGAVSIDLAVGLVTFALWVLALRAPVLDYAPAWVRERMGPRAHGGRLSALWVVLALELGTLTHLLLDELTHEGGWLDGIAPWSAIQVGTFAMANVIHGVVSFALAVVLALWVQRWVQRTPPEPRTTRLRSRERNITWIALLTALAAVGAAWWLAGIAAGEHPLDPDLLGHSFFVAVAAAGALALVVASLWHLRKAR